MSEKKADNAILKETKVSSVTSRKTEESNCIAMSKTKDGVGSNTRKNTVIATSSPAASSSVISGPSIMEGEDATTTTIAIGNETYTIGEPKYNISMKAVQHLKLYLKMMKVLKVHFKKSFFRFASICLRP